MHRCLVTLQMVTAPEQGGEPLHPFNAEQEHESSGLF